MKKIYINPEITMVSVKVQVMQAASPNGEGKFDPNEPPQDPSGFDARRSNNAWDEEDEEDF